MESRRSRMNSIQEKMRKAGCSENQIRRFDLRVERFRSGLRATISESEIQPVQALPRLSDIAPAPELLSKVAVVKLNGGLGTSMGLMGPKGLLEVARGKDFYEILIDQVRSMGKTLGFQPALVFMNSFNTEKQTSARLLELGLKQSLPSAFLQSQVPKISKEGRLVDCEEDYAWCPPGHGDIYASLLDSGLKQQLLDEGIRYLFVSNIDNLGAVLDSRPLSYMVAQGLSFLMEVTRRGPSDRKGGHLALSGDGGFLLREVAQCPEEDKESFQDIQKHPYFNTNNLWIDLRAVDESWTDLPLIVNRKPVRPHDTTSEMVVQLEQAMGAAIGVVDKSGAIEVGRERFLPVKTTTDLFLLRSDLYQLSDDGLLRRQVDKLPSITLGLDNFRMIQDFEKLVLEVPSLRNCRSLKVDGPVVFGPGLVLNGDVHLQA